MSNIRYKLTDEKMQTYGGCQWALGEKKTTSGEGHLCGPGWLHCYSDPLLGIMFNPMHAGFKSPRLFEAEVSGKHLGDLGVKDGWTEMTLVKEIPLPVVSTMQRVAFGILCAKKVCSDPVWNRWADRWLSGEDRSQRAAYDFRRSSFAAFEAAAAATAAGASAATKAAKAADSAVTYADAKHNAVLGLRELVRQAMEVK